MLRSSTRSSCARLRAVILLAPAFLSAHDLYILPESFHPAPKTTISVAFHNGDAFPESEAAPSLQRLVHAELRSKRNRTGIEDLKIVGKTAAGRVQTGGAGIAILSVETVPNPLKLPADKFLDYLKEEGLTNVIAWREQHGESLTESREQYSKFSKSLISIGQQDDFYRTSVGSTIEIIPVRNPYSLRVNDSLPVTVLFRGKPAVDVQVEAAWAAGGQKEVRVIGRTNHLGSIDVPLNHSGKWRIHSIVMERAEAQPMFDWQSFWASLTFEIN